MKPLITAIILLLIALFTSCDMRSGTAKEEMDKFSGSPTPTISPLATATPVDPADIVQVDTTIQGDILTVNGYKQNKGVSCKKFDQVMVNGSGNVVQVSGACRQIIVNGDSNQITVEAAMEFVFNGTDNSLKYARFANGKQPVVTENQSGNIVEKIAIEPGKKVPSQNKNAK